MIVLRWGLALWIVNLTKLSRALSITYPNNDTTWAREEALRIEWTSISADPDNVTVCLINKLTKPLFSEAIQDEVPTAANSYTVDANSSILVGPDYQIALVEMTEISEKTVATSETFTITSLDAESQQPPPPERASVDPKIIAVVVVVGLLAAVGCTLLCWCCRRRRRSGRPTGPSKPRSQTRRSRNAAIAASPSQATLTSPVRDAKPDVEDIAASRRPGPGHASHNEMVMVNPSPMQPSTQPPTMPAQATAELPLFTTPRSSRQIFGFEPHAKDFTELDTQATLWRSQSVRDLDWHHHKRQTALPDRLSRRLSLPNISRQTTAAEPGKCQASPARTRPGIPRETIGSQRNSALVNTTLRRPARSGRLSWHQLFRFRRVAELEGSVTSPAPPCNIGPRSGEDSRHAISGRSRRISLHRLIQSKKSAELEAKTDALPEYSCTHKSRNSTTFPLPLLSQDVDLKMNSPAQRTSRGTTSAVELDASELLGPPPPSSSSLAAARPLSMTSATRAPGAPARPLRPFSFRRSQVAEEWTDESEGGIQYGRSEGEKSVNSMGAATQRRAPSGADGVSDLYSTDSEGDLCNYSDLAVHNGLASAGRSPLKTSTPRKNRPPSTHVSPTGQCPEAGGDYQTAVHDLNVTRTPNDSLDKRQIPGLVSDRDESTRRGHDFLTFQKHVTEAQRRTKGGRHAEKPPGSPRYF